MSAPTLNLRICILWGRRSTVWRKRWRWLQISLCLWPSSEGGTPSRRSERGRGLPGDGTGTTDPSPRFAIHPIPTEWIAHLCICKKKVVLQDRILFEANFIIFTSLLLFTMRGKVLLKASTLSWDFFNNWIRRRKNAARNIGHTVISSVNVIHL